MCGKEEDGAGVAPAPYLDATYAKPRLRQCGNPDCRICRWNDDEHDDNGHPDDTLAELLIGAAAIAILFLMAVVLLPVLAS